MIKFPDIVDYKIGDRMNKNDFQFKVTYNNGATKIISDDIKITPDVLNKNGVQTVIFSYGGKEIKYDVNVDNEFVNPKTGINITLIFIIMFSSIGFFTVIIKKNCFKNLFSK